MTSLWPSTLQILKTKSALWPFLSNGETGCTISHQLIQKKYSQMQEKPIVILEDDARIPDLIDFEVVIHNIS
jgi:GR25 family glycosyltransferase involved in LPS biosynthesis